MKFYSSTLLAFHLLRSCNAASVEDDFFRAMEAESFIKNIDTLQRRLLKNSKPKRSLSDVAEDGYDQLDLTGYALKYLGCQNIRQFDDDLAADGDSDTVLGLRKFVTFRLCNARKCSSYNKYGCNDDFGEYVIDLEEYLQIMEQYQYEKFLEYCATCNDCMNPPDDDALFYNQTDDAFNNTNETTASSFNAKSDCDYYAACNNYRKACKKFDSSNTDDDNKKFFTSCNAFNVGNDVSYIGPRCGDDGYTIVADIFKDEYCTTFIRDDVNMKYYTGIDMDNTGLSFYSSPSCISCMNKNSYALFEDESEGNEAYELCEYLFDSSGQCNRYMNSNYKNAYPSQQQLENEEKVCNFVESLMENNYNEHGEIMLGFVEDFDFTKWYRPSEYKKVTHQVSSGQLFGLFFSISIVLGLFGYAAYLHSEVTRIWSPKQQYPKYPLEDYDVNRQGSGIKMRRSADENNVDMKDSFTY